jgi:hypothetical protein
MYTVNFCLSRSLIYQVDAQTGNAVPQTAECPAGKFSMSAVASCTNCPLGKYQNQPGQSFCEQVRSGYVLIHVADGGSAVVQTPCPSTGVDCTQEDRVPRYQGSVWHNPQVQVPNCTATEPVSCTNMYLCETKVFG